MKAAIKKIISAVVSSLLALIFVLQTPMYVLADSQPNYLKEIRLATAPTRAEAVAALENQGFKVLDCNIRDSASGNVCYLGYKTTTNEDEAISDVRLMNAKGGINEKKYRDLVKQWKSGIDTSAEYLKDACLATAANYEKGSPLAQAAVEILDMFEVDGVKLSTYLFDSSRTDEDYQDILLICADNVVTTIYGALHLGTADYGTDTFASRLAALDFSKYDYSKIENQSDNEEFTQCWELTARVIEQLQNFALDYDEAMDYFAMLEEEEGEEAEDVEAPTEEETQAYWKKFVNEKYQNSEVEEEQELYKYANIAGLYEKLAQYSLNGTDYENLAEYIYTCGDPFDENGEESDKIVWRIYPLVSCLTKGQVFTLQYGGVSALVSALDANTESNKNNAVAAVGELKAKIAENGLERISVFYNVNRDIYDETVAFTTEAERIGTSSSSYDQLVTPKEDDQVVKNLTNVILIGGMIAGSLLAAAVIVLGITAAVAGTTMAVLVDVGITAILAGSIGIASGGMAMASAAIVSGVIGTVVIVLALVVLAVLVICALIALFRKIFADDDDDDDKESLPDIPDTIYDVKGSEFVKYSAVTDLAGSPVDLANGKGDEWDVMYVSYEENAGTPVTVDSNPFVVQTDSSTVPDGYTPVSRFGYIDTANLHSFMKSSGSPLYLFYQGQSRDGDTKQKYVYDIMLSCESSAEAARLGIIKKGYTPVEQNLTPGTGKVSYIGYVTTSNENDAITDIRVAYYYSGKSYLYGNKSDGSSVEYTLVGELVTKASLYYTKQKSNGSAIVADFRFESSRLSANSGYEPVTLFCGGSGYNFYNGCNDWNGVRAVDEDNRGKTLYMYFKPSVSFGTNNTEYLSGFAFCSGGSDAVTFAAQNGFNLTRIGKHDLAKGVSDGGTYILYSTTYNPYRAITEIGTFNASQSAEGLYDNITVGGVGYAVCEVFATVCDDGFFVDDYYRLLRPSNSIISRLEYEGSVMFDLDETYQAENNFGKYVNVPMKGLYVAGPNSAKQPLTLYDVDFCTSKDTAGRTAFTNSKGETVYCKPAADLADCYSTIADNLTFEWSYEIYTFMDDHEIIYGEEIVFENYLRIFYRGSVEKRGKYVSNIIVSTVIPESDNDKKYSCDQAIVKLLAKGKGEILKVNFACSSSAQPTSYKTVTIDGEDYDIEVCKEYTGASSYIMIQYTDYLMDSVRAATLKWYSGASDTPTNKLSYQKVNFNLCGDKVKGISGYYAIYTSKNGQLGSAVTDVVLDSEYLKNGWTTVSDCDGLYKTSEDYILKIKQVNNCTSQSYIKNLTVSKESTKQKCLEYLYKKGCTNFIDHDKNNGCGGDYIYLGYNTTVDSTDTNVLTGIQVALKDSSTHDANYTDSNGMYYTCISDDLNKGCGGKYTYLYVSTTKKAGPITRVATTSIMCETLSLYTEYKTQTWVTCEDAASGTNGKYKLCYKQKSTDWSIDENGYLSIHFNGDMPNYQTKFYIFYTRPGAMGGMKKCVSYLPEWCDYGDEITQVYVYYETTSIDESAFVNCNNITDVFVYCNDCKISANAIPTGAVIHSTFDDSTAATYAATYGHTFKRITDGAFIGTVFGNSNAVVVISISSVLVLCGAAALVIKKRKKKQKKEEKSGEN